MELVFRLPSESRLLTFASVSQQCDLPVDQVEWLIMKGLALKVIKGHMDEVEKTVKITWVAPRVLDQDQIKQLKNRLNQWQKEVDQTTLFVESNAQHII